MEIETVIIGAGQAGLSVGRYLKEKEKDFIILDENEEVGTSWRQRYDSLRLDSFAKYTALEGFPFPGSPLHQPTKEEAADYLRLASTAFGLAPRFGVKVLRVEKRGGRFAVTATNGIYSSRFVVIATGPFHMPYIPEISKQIPGHIRQLHSADYRNPGQLLPGKTLVVGGGNSGGELAKEIADSGRDVLFSYKGKFRSIRSSPFSQWLAYALGLAHVPKHTLLGRLIIWHTKGKAVGISVRELLRHPNIVSVGPIVRIEHDRIVCEKGAFFDVATIVWATGYTSDFSIVSVPGFDPDSHKRGVTNIPGLFILNTRWQYSKSSSHLAGISRDAKYIADYIISLTKKDDMKQPYNTC